MVKPKRASRNIVEVNELAKHRNRQTTERYMKAKESRLRELLASRAKEA
jgi:hypothetical protein